MWFVHLLQLHDADSQKPQAIWIPCVIESIIILDRVITLPTTLHALTVVTLLYYLTFGALAIGLHYNVRLPWRKNYPLRVHIAIETLFLLCLHGLSPPSTEGLRSGLYDKWKTSYEGDKRLVWSVQQEYKCCGFEDTDDMVVPSFQAVDLKADEVRRYQALYTEVQERLSATCAKITVAPCEECTMEMLALCGETNNQTLPLCEKMKSNSLEICWTIKENLALCEKAKRENLEFQEELHEANLEFIASLAEAEKYRCTSNRSCCEPWSRYLQSTGGFILVVLEVMFMIKCGVLTHQYFQLSNSWHRPHLEPTCHFDEKTLRVEEEHTVSCPLTKEGYVVLQDHGTNHVAIRPTSAQIEEKAKASDVSPITATCH
ncbi:MAG: hypothetical protein Q9215_004620 [Flavoplaca cf. flavocitrina]